MSTLYPHKSHPHLMKSKQKTQIQNTTPNQKMHYKIIIIPTKFDVFVHICSVCTGSIFFFFILSWGISSFYCKRGQLRYRWFVCCMSFLVFFFLISYRHHKYIGTSFHLIVTGNVFFPPPPAYNFLVIWFLGCTFHCNGFYSNRKQHNKL